MGVEFSYRALTEKTSLSLSAPYSFQAGGKVGIVGKKAGGLADARHICQVFDSYVCSSNYALLTITELPNNELTGIHTLSLPPLLL